MVFVIELSQVPKANTVTELKHELQKMTELANFALSLFLSLWSFT